MTLTYGGYAFLMFLVVMAYRLGYDEGVNDGRTVRRQQNRNNNNNERGY